MPFFRFCKSILRVSLELRRVRYFNIESRETFSVKFRMAVPFNVSRKATQTELKEKLHTITSEKRNLEKTVVTIRMQ